MTWVKRNLYFLIGSIVALALMGMATYYLLSKLKLNNSVKEKLNQSYTDLKRLNEQKPHPGNDKIDNIKAAKVQQDELRAFIRKTTKSFQRIPPLPDSPKVSSEEFSDQLRQTIVQLQRDAAAASVTLPPKYNFSFEGQKLRTTFAPGSLQPLSVQLGEVKAICDILFHAKINALDSIKREPVSTDDVGTADYHGLKSTTNDLAVLTPYELSFRCFSPELASVMAGFASSQHGFIVKGISVDPAPTEASATMPTTAPTLMPAPTAPPPAAFTPPNPASEFSREANAFAQRYGTKPGFLPGVAPTPPPTYYVAPALAASKGLPTVLNEKPLRIMLMIYRVKLQAPK